MSNNPPRNYSNLGHGVTTRLISWEQTVRDAEGSRWNLPIGKYFFGDGNQFVFVEYNDAVQGPNGPGQFIRNGVVVAVQQPNPPVLVSAIVV